MAVYQCSACTYEAHYSEFKAHMSENDRDLEIQEQDFAYDNDEDGSDSLCCPECGSESAFET
jgi:rubredoxin